MQIDRWTRTEKRRSLRWDFQFEPKTSGIWFKVACNIWSPFLQGMADKTERTVIAHVHRLGSHPPGPEQPARCCHLQDAWDALEFWVRSRIVRDAPHPPSSPRHQFLRQFSLVSWLSGASAWRIPPEVCMGAISPGSCMLIRVYDLYTCR